MEASSPRFKSLIVTVGLSFWFFIITSSLNLFSLEIFAIFLTSVLILTQIFTRKLSKGLDIFAIINTKIFLGVLFVLVISIYGTLFKFLKIDLLRLKKQKKSYWIDIESSNNTRKQY